MKEGLFLERMEEEILVLEGGDDGGEMLWPLLVNRFFRERIFEDKRQKKTS